MREFEAVASYAIALAKQRGLEEVSTSEFLLAGLRAVARFGTVQMGGVTVDLEELGVDWVDDGGTEHDGGGKVAYSEEVVGLLDRAARIARGDGGGPVRVYHLLAPFAGLESGLMGELKARYGFTSATWRAAVAELASREPATAEASYERPARAEGKDYLTPEQAADELGVHVQTVRGYVRSGKLVALRLAGERAIRIRRSDLETALEPLVPQP
jgi:excisionase family DNA binding protein